MSFFLNFLSLSIGNIQNKDGLHISSSGVKTYKYKFILLYSLILDNGTCVFYTMDSRKNTFINDSLKNSLPINAY